MKKLLLTTFVTLLTTLCAQAQRSEGTATADVPGRTLEGNLPRLTSNGQVEGVVKMIITVDPYGAVHEAIADMEESTLSNTEVVSAARKAAMRAHFNIDANAPALQKGSIIYTFITSEFPETDESAFKFMGIPIGETKEEMIDALKTKGFKQEWGDEYLTGIFNGENVRIYIGANHEIVDMITVEYPFCSEENDTRIKYNMLLSRFNRNAKYVSVMPRAELPSNEPLYSNIYRNSKYYDTIFFNLHPDVRAKDWVQDFKTEYQKRFKKPLGNLSYEEMEEALFCLPLKVSSAIAGVVWFTLIDTHRININYVNLNNRPRGEDL